MGERKEFRVCAVYDTETTTLNRGPEARAFVCLYIFNDIRGCDLYDFKNDGKLSFLRTLPEAIEYIERLISYGLNEGVVPVICAYNLQFDLISLQNELASRYPCQVNAQSATNIYTFDVLDADDKPMLRFWDTYFLETGGLAAMGKTCGLPKAVGDWDYSLIRTPETPLTEEELFYAGRDTQVIPAYLSYLLKSNEWLQPADFGCRVLTKTSLARQMAKHEIADLTYTNAKGRKVTLLDAFEATCRRELPPDYYSYALRKACFRGGLTFTAANNANQVKRNVVSLDATSMHHTFLNGAEVPVKFLKAEPSLLNTICRDFIFNVSIEDTLYRYNRPLWYGVHACVEFTNLRLRKGSAFEHYGIATLAEGKFMKDTNPEDWESERDRIALADLKANGWRDRAKGAVFAFGKLYSADSAIVFANEIELWCISRVYEWDSFEAICGEWARNYVLPPDYASLQSNILYERKNDAKRINNSYEEGKHYPDDIPHSIPDGIASSLRDGSCTEAFFDSWYNATVKGQFNACYGIQAQDIFKPDYEVADDGELEVDNCTRTTPDNFESKIPKNPRVFYNYGMRIVGGSRRHLIIAIELIYSALGDKAEICGGDTDSMKISLDPSVSPDDVVAALEPLHKACRIMLAKTQRRIRENYPELASNLTRVGEFDIEPAEKKGKVAYDYHFEAWNKARLSVVNGHSHITCAGLSRPEYDPDLPRSATYNVEDLVDALLSNGHTFEEIAPRVLGYNTEFTNAICHSLMKRRPGTCDRIEEDVTDYLGNTCHVSAPQVVALYEASRVIGETSKFTNACNVLYLESLGRSVDTTPVTIGCDFDKDGERPHPYIEIGVTGDAILQ